MVLSIFIDKQGFFTVIRFKQFQNFLSLLDVNGKRKTFTPNVKKSTQQSVSGNFRIFLRSLLSVYGKRQNLTLNTKIFNQNRFYDILVKRPSYFYKITSLSATPRHNMKFIEKFLSVSFVSRKSHVRVTQKCLYQSWFHVIMNKFLVGGGGAQRH